MEKSMTRSLQKILLKNSIKNILFVILIMIFQTFTILICIQILKVTKTFIIV